MEKVKSRLADEIKERKENFIVPMKKRKCVLEECSRCLQTDNIGLPTPQPSDSEGEDHEILAKKDSNNELAQVW